MLKALLNGRIPQEKFNTDGPTSSLIGVGMSLGPSQEKLMFNLHTGFNHGSSWVRFRLG